MLLNYNSLNYTNQSIQVVKNVSSNNRPIINNKSTIPHYNAEIDTDNYFSDWEIDRINESILDYENGNYKTGSIKDLLEDLHL
ncbi:MAG: hypothetical protein ACYCTB_06520 [bacterium]